MINLLELRTFKCFEDLKLPLGPLTLLSGTNASGKSSVLQSLVLLHQTLQENEWSNRILLNGDVVRLGTVSDIVDQGRGRNSMEIGLADDYASCRWSFSGDRSDMSMGIENIIVDGFGYPPPYVLKDLLPSLANHSMARELMSAVKRLTYITAEREGPRDVYPLEDKHSLMLERAAWTTAEAIANAFPVFYSRVGSRGENAMSVLYWGRDELVSHGLRFPETVPTLFHQVGARMNCFFPGCAIDVQHVKSVNAVTLGIRVTEDTDFLRPIHCGFGITQVLPIVISALSIPQNDLLLIENPEVHLHPAGQALMGQFLAELANHGIQIIVETHSDHVLNGIRRAVKSGIIPADKVVLHFFKARTSDDTQVLSPVIDSSGNVDVWPEGFFDQFDTDMDYFAGWGK